MADNPPQAPPKEQPVVETAPDPDEDDLDDLDDVLDQFSATNLEARAGIPSASGPGRPSTTTTTSDPFAAASASIPKAPAFPSDDEFAKQLQAGMADLLSELDQSPDMQRQFEDFMKELGTQGPAGLGNLASAADALSVPTLAGPSSASTTTTAVAPAAASSSTTTTTAAATSTEAQKVASDAAKAEATFQDTIRRTIERMQESGDQASAAAAAPANEEDFLAQMLKEMESGGFGDGMGSEEDFSKMLMGMMEQLTNRDILYEPMKELNEKFPGWLEQNSAKTDKADLARYQEQQQLVGEIVAKFDEKDYSDSSPSHREYIVERMQKMQNAGAPPPDLVGDMNTAQEALSEIDSGCPTQ